MCSINGFVNFGTFTNNKSVDLRRFLAEGTERGRDSFGIYMKDSVFGHHLAKCVDKSKKVEFCEKYSMISLGLVEVFMNNMRAEPTSNSEWIKNKTINDTQPFATTETVIVHNGTIANDGYFNKSFENVITINEDGHNKLVNSDISIDSSIFLNFKTSEELLYALSSNKVVGSYALCQYFPREKKIVLAKNYMPLYLLFDYTNEVIWFASSQKTLDVLKNNETTEYADYELPPYSCVILDFAESFRRNIQTIKIFNYKLRKEQEERALVVCSGGLDSTTLASYIKYCSNGIDTDIKLLHFLYGCKAEEREKEAIIKIAKRLNCEYEFLDIKPIFKVLSSPLTDNSVITEGDKGIEYAHEWVPARNLILMSIAVGYAEKYKFNKLYLGANLDEASAYPDNTVDFLDKLNSVLPYATQNGTSLNIEKPFVNMMKHEIVKLAIEIGAPLDLMWSCYHDGEKPCGKCGPCTLRKIAFAKNGLEDTYLTYQE